MLKFLPLLALIGFLTTKPEPEPIFKSPRKFYRAGDTIEVVLDKDTSIQVGVCMQTQTKAQYYYRVEKWEGDKWWLVYRSTDVCRALLPSTALAEKGFTIKHHLVDQGTFRVIVSDRFYSNKFELR
jgi:hypothetical protein